MKLTKQQQDYLIERMEKIFENNVYQATVLSAKGLNAAECYWKGKLYSPTREEVKKKFEDILTHVIKNLKEYKDDLREEPFFSRHLHDCLFIECIIDGTGDDFGLTLDMGIEYSVFGGIDVGEVFRIKDKGKLSN